MKGLRKGFILAMIVIGGIVLSIIGTYYLPALVKPPIAPTTQIMLTNAQPTSANEPNSAPSAIHSTPKAPVLTPGLGAIILRDSGSTNTNAFTITINADGSGAINTFNYIIGPISSSEFPTGTLDYKDLHESMMAVPTLQFPETCAKSASFATTETLTFQGRTSGDMTCMPSGQTYSNLSTNVRKIIDEAECFDPKNTSGRCQLFRLKQSSNLDSGVISRVSVSPVPGCHNPANAVAKGYYPCAVGGYQAKFAITKSDGSFVQNISTDENGDFSVPLEPGNYILTDISAGSSNFAQVFFDENASYANGKTASKSDDAISYNFTIPPHTVIYIDPLFNGNQGAE